MKIISLSLLIAFLGTFAYGAEFPICDAIGNQGAPDVAFVGNEYIVVYDSVSEIWGARVSIEGNVIDRFRIHIPDIPIWRDTLPKVATDGERWFVVWTARGALSTERFLGIWGAIYEGSTAVVEPFMIQTSMTCFPDIGCNGEIFLITGSATLLSIPQKSYIRGRLYDGNGNPLFSEVQIDEAGGFFDTDDGYIACSSIDSDGENFIVVYPWCQYFESYNTQTDITLHLIKYKLITPDANILDGGTLFTGRTRGYSVPPMLPPEVIPRLYAIPPDGAFNGTNYFCSYHVLEDYSVLPNEGCYNVLGAIISQTGEILCNEIPVAVRPIYYNEFASSVTSEDRNFFVVWQDNRTGDFNIYSKHYSQNGDPLGDEIAVTSIGLDQVLPSTAFDGLNNLVVWQDWRNFNWDIYGNFLPKSGFWTDDSLALAYNGNRHLVRKPRTQEFHLVYVDRNKIIYRYSSNGGSNWTSPMDLGTGKLPAITLASDNLPSVTWSDEIGGLWYRRQTSPGIWSEIYHLYSPLPSPYVPHVSGPSSIVIMPSAPEDMVHILVTFVRRPPIPINEERIFSLEDYSFGITEPYNGAFELIEQEIGITLSFPSIAKCDVDNSLHAVWQRGDTICYATRQIGQTWNNWGPRFGDQGIQSAHPFVETYGDMVYVVWQHQETPGAPEEVYKGWRQISDPTFPYWTNFSRTPDTKSLFPVSASGFFTGYVDEITPYPNCGWEIFYKVHPEDIAYNISQTLARSTYPQSVCRFTAANFYLYTAWLDGDNVPYEIRFKKIRYIPTAVAYLTAINGYETPSPYLVARDSFISDWPVPVDIGYETITYQFPLEPGYRYKIKVVVYHQSSGEWKEWIIIDGKMKHQIKYSAHEPETLEFWVPPAFYKDGIIKVVFDRIKGDFATAGPIEFCRYEYEEGESGQGGPMAQQSYPSNSGSITIFPNPFKEKIDIRLQMADVGQGFSLANSKPEGLPYVSLKIYDVAGRLVKSFNYSTNSPFNQILWDGCDENGRTIPQGVYFLEFANSDTKATVCHKIIKVE